jgi:hypothetical protein
LSGNFPFGRYRLGIGGVAKNGILMLDFSRRCARWWRRRELKAVEISPLCAEAHEH